MGRREVLAGLTALGATALAACAPFGLGPSGATAPLLVFGSNGSIVSLGVDGRGRRQLTKTVAGAQSRDPCWAADGKRIAYAQTPPLPTVRGPGGLVALPVTDIRVMNADGSDDRILVPHPAPGVGFETPIWAPDGASFFVTYTELVMESSSVKDQLVEVARVPVGGGARQTLFPGALFPTVSRDGRRIAFVADLPQGQALMIADADGKNARTLVPAGQLDGLAAPRLSPDARQVAFSAVAPMAPVPTPTSIPGRSTPAGTSRSTSGVPAAASGPGGLLTGLLGWLRPKVAMAHGLPMDVFVIDADGANLKRLTQLGEDNPAAVWSPDGKQLAILAGGGVYRMAADGSDFASVDENGGHGNVDWQPA
jgi:Tol biopolymer transport system component